MKSKPWMRLVIAAALLLFSACVPTSQGYQYPTIDPMRLTPMPLTSPTPTPTTEAPAVVAAATVQVVGQFTDSVEQWRPEIDAWATAWAESGVTADLIATVIQVSSCGNPAYDDPTSPSAGLFGIESFNVPVGQDIFNWETNAKIAMPIMGQIRNSVSENDIALFFAGWKQRSAMVKSFGDWSRDTIAFYWDASPIYAGAKSGDGGMAVREWLNGNGAVVCAGAGVIR